MVATDDGQSLIAYTGSDAGQMTVGGELNKLASNIALGRDVEAVHWRSDAVEGLLLGEAAAISVLGDQRSTYRGAAAARKGRRGRFVDAHGHGLWSWMLPPSSVPPA